MSLNRPARVPEKGAETVEDLIMELWIANHSFFTHLPFSYFELGFYQGNDKGVFQKEG